MSWKKTGEVYQKTAPKKSARDGFALIVIAVIALGGYGVYKQQEREVASRTPRAAQLPPAGYVWATDDPENLETRWVKGRRHPEAKGFESGSEPGTWQPRKGLYWADTMSTEPRTVQRINKDLESHLARQGGQQ